MQDGGMVHEWWKIIDRVGRRHDRKMEEDGEEKLNSKFTSSEDAMQNLYIFKIIL